MNKPAAKEPSMDEILSSIRQIIADEDQQGASDAQAEDASGEGSMDIESSLAGEGDIPLTLNTDQMLSDEPEDDPEAELVGKFNPVSEFAASEPEPEPEPEPQSAAEPEPVAEIEEDEGEEEALDLAAFGSDLEQEADAPEQEEAPLAEAPSLVVPDDIAFDEDLAPLDLSEEVAPPEPEESAPSADPLPNPDLTAQMADELLAPATNAAVKSTMSKLSSFSTISNAVTLDAMVREMMRPMLKEWLDENLPPLVERVVEREIARIARGE